MRKINIYFLILVLLTGCYGVEEQELTPLAELNIGNPSDVINADLGVELVFDAQISSGNNKQLNTNGRMVRRILLLQRFIR